MPRVPPATLPHPHTMKLGEFMTHTLLYGNVTLEKFLKTAFSRVTDVSVKEFTQNGLKKAWLKQGLNKINEKEFKAIFQAIQESNLQNPSTKSVLTVGEEGLAKSISKIGEVDFFSVVTRKPKICDFKPVVVEVAIARFLNRGSEEDSIQLLRFANRVPLQFDKASCAITKSAESVNWKSYGLQQSKNSLPKGPYVFAISVTSPFIKFKNASKETIDSSEDLIEEIRLALMQAGQKLSRHIKREAKAEDLERKKRHIEKFGPILVEGLAAITNANEARKTRASKGLDKILGRDADSAEAELEQAEARLLKLKNKQQARREASEGKTEAAPATKKKVVKKKATKKKVAKKVSKKASKKKATRKAKK